jgi:hypothetical protein
MSYQPMQTTHPLPAPMPSAVELAADYVRMVRSNGPQHMRNVAQCYDPKGYHDVSWIRWEVAELLPDYDWEDQGRNNQYHNLTIDAATLAVRAIWLEIDMNGLADIRPWWR